MGSQHRLTPRTFGKVFWLEIGQITTDLHETRGTFEPQDILHLFLGFLDENLMLLEGFDDYSHNVPRGQPCLDESTLVTSRAI